MQKYERAFLPIFTLSYSLLFYHQQAGVNIALFTVLLVGGYVLAQPALLRQRSTLGFAAAALFSALGVLLYGSSLALCVNLLSLLLFSASRVSTLSLPVVLLNGLYTITTLTVFIPMDGMALFRSKRNDPNRSSWGFLLYPAVGAVVLVFIALYRAMNPLFEKVTDRMYWDAISPAWLLFTLGGLVLMYGFIRQRTIPELSDWDKQQSEPLTPPLTPPMLSWKGALTILLFLLNILMLLITILDIIYLYLGKGLPDGVTHKQFVHHGVGILMVSVLIGSVILLFSFGSGLSFDRGNRLVKALSTAWLFQNLFMVVSTGWRNQIYIHEALLTYKRIGVFFWLALTACVLVFTWIKILNRERSWFVARGSALSAYILLLLSCAIDWDGYISSYNLSHIRDIAALDKRYLLDLSPGNLRLLYSIRRHPKFEIDSVYHYPYDKWASNGSLLDRKLYRFLKSQENDDWRSFNFRNARVAEDVAQLNREGKLDSLNLSACSAVDLECLRPVTTLRALRLDYSTRIDSQFIRTLAYFPKLNACWFDIPDLKDTVRLQQLRSIQVVYTHNILSRTDSAKLVSMHFPFQLRYY